jgi:hypothetical protein
METSRKSPDKVETLDNNNAGRARTATGRSRAAEIEEAIPR